MLASEISVSRPQTTTDDRQAGVSCCPFVSHPKHHLDRHHHHHHYMLLSSVVVDLVPIHRPSNHFINPPTRPRAQVNTAAGLHHGHVGVSWSFPVAASAAASSASIVRAAWAVLGSRGEIDVQKVYVDSIVCARRCCVLCLRWIVGECSVV